MYENKSADKFAGFPAPIFKMVKKLIMFNYSGKGTF